MNNTQKSRTQRRYSNDEVAAALAALDANGGNVTLTAEQLDLPRKTLESWRDAASGQADAVMLLRQQKREELAQRLEDLAHRMLDLLEENADDIKPAQAAIMLGIACDKVLALRSAGSSGPSVVVNVNPVSTTLTAEDIASAKRLLEPPRVLPRGGESVVDG